MDCIGLSPRAARTAKERRQQRETARRDPHAHGPAPVGRPARTRRNTYPRRAASIRPGEQVGGAHQIDQRADAHLLHDLAAVSLYSPLGNTELAPDLLFGLPATTCSYTSPRARSTWYAHRATSAAAPASRAGACDARRSSIASSSDSFVPAWSGNPPAGLDRAPLVRRPGRPVGIRPAIECRAPPAPPADPVRCIPASLRRARCDPQRRSPPAAGIPQPRHSRAPRSAPRAAGRGRVRNDASSSTM